jgi:uncharacterized membrane protein
LNTYKNFLKKKVKFSHIYESITQRMSQKLIINVELYVFSYPYHVWVVTKLISEKWNRFQLYGC